MRRSSDLVVVSSDMRASVELHQWNPRRYSHEPALEENMVSDGQTSWLNRGFIETGLSLSIPFPQMLNY